MLHINTINYKKPIIFLKIFPKFSEKITEFPQNFQKKLQLNLYIVSILTRKIVNLQNLRAAPFNSNIDHSFWISNTKRL